ncbi:MAG: methyltransferase RsmF C-terminal domain-like protein [Bacteroidota bacterium]|nr:RNA methyltransferase [Bacteroidota bacterium]MCA6443673.1 RNA methyltransferase [Bacteroidota bacterium]
MPQIPIELLNSLQHKHDIDVSAFIGAHDSEHKITSIRLNQNKPANLTFELSKPVLWNSNAFYLDERPYFTYDPLFHAGCYYVQEAGSMFIEHVLNELNFDKSNVAVLDACAAPGGKSTLLNSYLNEDSLLISNEFIKNRADILAYNLSKWGSCNSIVTNCDTTKFLNLPNFFDLVLVDAPCSGSGLFRKQPDAVEHWSEKAVKECSIRQKEILENLSSSVKPGGYLLYSTCSYSSEENENISQWLIEEQNFILKKININKNWGIVESEYGYRFYPHLTESEGFYISIFQKEESDHYSSSKLKKTNLAAPTKAEKKVIAEFLRNNEDLFKINQFLYKGNEKMLEFLSNYGSGFYIKKAGTCIGEMKGKDLVPNHELALSNYLSEHVRSIELNLDESLQFLKKESFQKTNIATGLTLIRHKTHGIGWCKFLPNRMNNYLPNEYKIMH